MEPLLQQKIDKREHNKIHRSLMNAIKHNHGKQFDGITG